MEKGKIELDLTSVKAMIIQCIYIFLGGGLQVVYGDPLRITLKQNLPCQIASVLLDC